MKGAGMGMSADVGKSLKAGLKTRSPSVDDASRKLPRSPTVNDGAVRSEPSKQDPTIGPRTA